MPIKLYVMGANSNETTSAELKLLRRAMPAETYFDNPNPISYPKHSLIQTMAQNQIIHVFIHQNPMLCQRTRNVYAQHQIQNPSSCHKVMGTKSYNI